MQVPWATHSAKVIFGLSLSISLLHFTPTKGKMLSACKILISKPTLSVCYLDIVNIWHIYIFRNRHHLHMFVLDSCILTSTAKETKLLWTVFCTPVEVKT